MAGPAWQNLLLFAAALDPQIAAVVVQLPYASYREEADKRSPADVPGILAAFDLPAINSTSCPLALVGFSHPMILMSSTFGPPIHGAQNFTNTLSVKRPHFVWRTRQGKLEGNRRMVQNPA